MHNMHQGFYVNTTALSYQKHSFSNTEKIALCLVYYPLPFQLKSYKVLPYISRYTTATQKK